MGAHPCHVRFPPNSRRTPRGAKCEDDDGQFRSIREPLPRLGADGGEVGGGSGRGLIYGQPKPTDPSRRPTSAFRGKADNICSQRVFPSLTQLRHWTQSIKSFNWLPLRLC